MNASLYSVGSGEKLFVHDFLQCWLVALDSFTNGTYFRKKRNHCRWSVVIFIDDVLAKQKSSIRLIRWFLSFCHRYRSFVPLSSYIGLHWCPISFDFSEYILKQQHKARLPFHFNLNLNEVLIIASRIECVLKVGRDCGWLRHIR